MTLPTKTFDAAISVIGGASKYLNHMGKADIVVIFYQSVAEAKVLEYFSHFNECLGGVVGVIFTVDITTVSVRHKLEQRIREDFFFSLKRLPTHDNESRELASLVDSILRRPAKACLNSITKSQECNSRWY